MGEEQMRRIKEMTDEELFVRLLFSEEKTMFQQLEAEMIKDARRLRRRLTAILVLIMLAAASLALLLLAVG